MSDRKHWMVCDDPLEPLTPERRKKAQAWFDALPESTRGRIESGQLRYHESDLMLRKTPEPS